MAFDDREENQDETATWPWQQRKPAYGERFDEQQTAEPQNYGGNPEVAKGLAEMMAQYRTMPGPNGEYYRRVYPSQPKAEPSTSNESNESMFREILKKARTGDFSPGSRLMEIRDPNAVGSGPGYWPYQHGIFSTFYPGGKEAMLGLHDDSRGASSFATPKLGSGQSGKPAPSFAALAGTQPSSKLHSSGYRVSVPGKSTQSTNGAENNPSSQQPQSNPMNGQYERSILPAAAPILSHLKQPRTIGAADWSGGQANPGEPIVNSGRFTDYPQQGKRKVGGSHAWRNNNPGNIKYSKSSPAAKNAMGPDYAGFAVFPTMQDGIEAQSVLWHTPAYQNRTLEQAVNSWTSGDPAATREAYLRDLVTKTGVSANAKISALTEEQLQDLQRAQREHEGRQKGRIIDIPHPKSGGRKK